VPRKGHTLHRDVLADPIYNSKIVTKLVNSIMLDGKKGVAQKIVMEHSRRLPLRQRRMLWKYLKKQ
jgi:ribosomal protein S7